MLPVRYRYGAEAPGSLIETESTMRITYSRISPNSSFFGVSGLIGAIGLATAAAAGQSINIDFGPAATTAPSTYAGAGAVGVWNTVAEPGVHPLVDLKGNATQVTLDVVNYGESFDDPGTTGDVGLLLDDGLVGTGDAVSRMTLSGFEDGLYEVVAYGWTPGGPDLMTHIGLNDALEFTPIGGPWTGQLEAGVTHTVREVEITGGLLTVDLAGSFIASSGFLNGLQIRPVQTDVSPADLDGDGVVGLSDLLMVLTVWSDGHGCDGIGPCPDLDHDNTIGFGDVLVLLGEWTS